MRFDNRQIRSAIALLAAVVGCALVAEPAAAQGPNPFVTPNAKLKQDAKLVVDSLMAGAFANASDAAKFDAYFNEFIFPQFANPKIADLGRSPSMADMRKSFRNRYFGAGKKGAIYDRLHDLTFAMMVAIIRAKFPDDPAFDTLRCNALKYNAMLIIGDLNKEEAPVGGRPQPSLEALQFMLIAVDNPRAPDYLRVPALLGIERQAECYGEHPLPADRQQALIKSMLTLLKQRDPGPTRDAEAQIWLRRLAAQNLGLIGQPGANGGEEVVAALATELRDRANALSLRCACAAAFSEMKFTGSEKINTADIALDMGVLALEILDKERAWAEANSAEPNRRRLKSALGSVADGLGSPNARHGIFSYIIPPANKEAVKVLTQTVSKASKIADKASLSVSDLTKNREELELALKDPKLPRRVALPKPAPVAPPKTGPGSTDPSGATASRGPLADNKERAPSN